MDVLSLIPAPDTLPARWWFFEGLDIIAFIIHIILINVVLGGLLIIMYSSIRGGRRSVTDIFSGPVIPKIPTALALGINLGVALLLFAQTLYGSLLYSSSILTGTWWILVIPLVVIAYYGAYLQAHSAAHGKTGLGAAGISAALLLLVLFIFVNNMTLMAQPEKWSAFFTHRGGSYLNIKDPALIPRYLHFITASIAVAGLFVAMLARMRRIKNPGGTGDDEKRGLKIFAWATIVQITVGFAFLISLPENIMLLFLGGNTIYTSLLGAGILLSAGAVITAFIGKTLPAAAHLAALITVMALTRANLRSAYLEKYFSVKTMPSVPEYGPMLMFIGSLAIVVISVVFMLQMIPRKETGRTF